MELSKLGERLALPVVVVTIIGAVALGEAGNQQAHFPEAAAVEGDEVDLPAIVKPQPAK